MALTPTQEAQVLQLVAEQAALLSLADNEATIISKLGATKVNLSSLGSAVTFDDADIMLIRQGTTDLSIAGSVVKAAVAVPDATDTVKGKSSLAVAANYPSVSDTESATPAYVSAAVAAAPSVSGLFSNLKVSATGLNALATITADELVVRNGTNYKTLTSVSVTPSLAASGANGLDSGLSAANTWYSEYVIWGAAVPPAGLFSLHPTTPTMPSGYTHKAKVGDAKSDGTANKFPIGFTQVGKKVFWLSPPLDINVASPGAARNTYTISVPTGYRVTAKLNIWINGDNTNAYVASPESADLTPVITSGIGIGGITGDAVDASGNVIDCLTNTSAQISIRRGDVTVGAQYVSTLGWEYA